MIADMRTISLKVLIAAMASPLPTSKPTKVHVVLCIPYPDMLKNTKMLIRMTWQA